MTHNTGRILAGDHKFVRSTIILLSNVNPSVSADNGSHHLHTLLIFLQDLHAIADHHRPSWSPGTH